MSASWAPSSWQAKPSQQMADWEDKKLAAKVLDKIGKLPPLIQAKEADSLKTLLAEAGRGERFIIQGGDCAERFIDCEAGRLEAQLKVILQLGLVHATVTNTPTVRIMRIAGQYGKPRSKPTEMVDGKEVMSFKGDNINGIELCDRKWDPERLLQGYFHSAATLNFLRSFSDGADSETLSAFGAIPDDAIKACAQEASVKAAKWTRWRSFFTAHEAMQLDLEEALTRKVGDKYYNLGAHLVWIGDRTRQLDGAHVEYFRGIENPIGVKVGPSMKPNELKDLVLLLNPTKEEGKLMLITRYGAGKVDGPGDGQLPQHIAAVKASGVPVVWQCDGMHGNGIVANGIKTRKAESVLAEILECAAVHKRCGTVLGGIHLEVTAQETVTECLGGCVKFTEEDLKRNYETYCDPRLNYAQGIEVAFKVANEAKNDEPASKRAKVV